eukprot:1805857-Amphidinium_carterae.3
MPDSPDPDWKAIVNAQPLTGEDLEVAVNERLMNILTPNSAIATPTSTAAAQVAFSGTAHRLPEDPGDVNGKAAEVESKPVSEESSPSVPVPMPPPPVRAAAAAAPPDDSRKPHEWDGWQTWILQPAPKPIVPDTDPPTTMPASKPYLKERPIIPPNVLAEDVDLTNPEFPIFGVWKKAMTKTSFPISRDAQAMENYKPLCSDILGFEEPVERMMELTPASGSHVFTPIQWNAECVKPPYNRIAPCTKGLMLI